MTRKVSKEIVTEPNLSFNVSTIIIRYTIVKQIMSSYTYRICLEKHADKLGGNYFFPGEILISS